MDARETVARLLPLEETTWVDGAGLNGAFAPVGDGYWDDIRRAREEELPAVDPWQRVPV